MITGFEIEPENGVPAVFSFVYNGQKIEGSTTGKMKFSNENKNENKTETHTDLVLQLKMVFSTMYNLPTDKLFLKAISLRLNRRYLNWQKNI